MTTPAPAKDDEMNTREAIYRALHTAIADRVHYLDCIKGCDMEDVVAKTRAEIAAWRKILKRRYGTLEHPSARALDGSTLMAVRDIPIRQPAAEVK